MRKLVSTSLPFTFAASAARARPAPIDAAISAAVTGPGNALIEPSGSRMLGKTETILRYRPAASTPATVRYKSRDRCSGQAVPQIPATAALRRLKEGNARFLRGRARFPTVQREILANLAKKQQPYATILGCSDSRVPPEL